MTQDSKDYVNVIESIHWKATDGDSDGNSGHAYGSVGISTTKQIVFSYYILHLC